MRFGATIIGVSERNEIMKKVKYQLLQKGEPVPMTKCDTIEEMIECVQAFEDVWKDMYPDKWDLSPYTIGTVSA